MLQDGPFRAVFLSARTDAGSLTSPRESAVVSCLVFFNKPYGVLSQFTPEGKWRALDSYTLSQCNASVLANVMVG